MCQSACTSAERLRYGDLSGMLSQVMHELSIEKLALGWRNGLRRTPLPYPCQNIAQFRLAAPGRAHPPAPSLAGMEGDVGAGLENHPADAMAVPRQATMLVGSLGDSGLCPRVPLAIIGLPVPQGEGLCSCNCPRALEQQAWGFPGSSPPGARVSPAGRREDTHLWEPWGQALPARKVTE